MTIVSVDWPSISASVSAIVNSGTVSILSPQGVYQEQFFFPLTLNGTYSANNKGVPQAFGISRQLVFYAQADPYPDPPPALTSYRIFRCSITIKGSQNNVYISEEIDVDITFDQVTIYQQIAVSVNSYSTIDEIILHRHNHYSTITLRNMSFQGLIQVGFWRNGYIGPLDIIGARSSNSTGSALLCKTSPSAISSAIKYNFYRSIIAPINVYYDQLFKDKIIFPIVELPIIEGVGSGYDASQLVQVPSNYSSLVGFVTTDDNVDKLLATLSIQVMVL